MNEQLYTMHLGNLARATHDEYTVYTKKPVLIFNSNPQDLNNYTFTLLDEAKLAEEDRVDHLVCLVAEVLLGENIHYYAVHTEEHIDQLREYRPDWYRMALIKEKEDLFDELFFETMAQIRK